MPSLDESTPLNVTNSPQSDRHPRRPVSNPASTQAELVRDCVDIEVLRAHCSPLGSGTSEPRSFTTVTILSSLRVAPNLVHPISPESVVPNGRLCDNCLFRMSRSATHPCKRYFRGGRAVNSTVITSGGVRS